MKYGVLLFLTGTLASNFAFAEPLEDRKALMKSNGQAIGALGAIAKGEKEFDATAVMAALEQINENAEAFDAEALFPEGSAGGDSKASPKIWEDFAGFQEDAEAWKTAVAAGVAAAPQDAAALQPVLGAIGQVCGACHEAYRLPSS